MKTRLRRRKPVKLSPNERGILGGIVNGMTYPEIAFCLGLSYETIKTYAKRLRAKLGVHSKTGLALWAVNNLERMTLCGASSKRRRTGTPINRRLLRTPA